MPKRAKGAKLAKARPVTAEEFERMLLKVPAVVGDEAAESWHRFLTGLWLSGLRLGEAMTLSWDETPPSWSIEPASTLASGFPRTPRSRGRMNWPR